MTSPALTPILSQIRALTDKKEKFLGDLINIRGQIAELRQALHSNYERKSQISKSLEEVKGENMELQNSNTLLSSEVEEIESTSLSRHHDMESKRESVSDLREILFQKRKSLEASQKESGELAAELQTVRTKNEARTQSLLSSHMEGEIEKRFVHILPS